MSVAEQFFDTNILLYLLSADAAKADVAETCLAQGGHISVQVLNEFASIAIRKLKMSHAEVREVLAPIRVISTVEPLTEATHDLGLQIAERYRLSLYDAMIAASAIGAGCKILLSEDMQDGLLIGRTLRVQNPFRHGLWASLPTDCLACQQGRKVLVGIVDFVDAGHPALLRMWEKHQRLPRVMPV